MYQVVVVVPKLGRLIAGPFTDDEEEEAQAVFSAWQRVAASVDMLPYIHDFKVSVSLKQYSAIAADTDVDWLYSRYVQPALPGHYS